MPILPDKSICCGCGACVDSCPRKALSLVEDNNGFYNIVINKEKCSDCRLCERSCHILQQQSLKKNAPSHIQPFAGWSKNIDVLKNSASGGAFTEFARDFLSQRNAVVYGAELMADSSVKHSRITDIKDLVRLQNSKYQQSNTVGIFNSVRDDLKAGMTVMFSGVPCQIAALYIFLKYNENLIRNLFTIEVLCHGVPSNVLHRFAINYYKAKAIKAYRNKDENGWIYGRSNKLSYVMFDDKIKVCKNRTEDFLFRSYLSFSFCRISCYSCKYAEIQRVSDMTIFDFWGFEKNERKSEYTNNMGCSVILANTDKGKSLIAGVTNMYLTSISWKEFLPYNQNLFMPTNKYLYKGSNYIHLITKLPKFVQKIIFQNGFSNPLLEYGYKKILNFIFRKENQKKIDEIQERSEYVLKKIKQ